MTGYVCIRCTTALEGPDCPGCGHKTIAMGPRRDTAREEDKRAISAIFTTSAIDSLPEQMRRLSNIVGRPIHQLEDLTEAEGRRAKAALRAWEKGRGTGGRLAAVRTPEGDEAA